jgi:hypothetical protein
MELSPKERLEFNALAVDLLTLIENARNRGISRAFEQMVDELRTDLILIGGAFTLYTCGDGWTVEERSNVLRFHRPLVRPVDSENAKEN